MPKHYPLIPALKEAVPIMINRPMRFAIIVIVLLIIIIVGAQVVLTPSDTNPAVHTALTFVTAAGFGDDALASSLVSAEIRAYAAANCRDGQLSACIDDITPDDWGNLMSVVFRRAAPEGRNWNVDLVATYQDNKGFSGVCISTLVEPVAVADGEAARWQVARYAGFVHCGEAGAREIYKTPDAPNLTP